VKNGTFVDMEARIFKYWLSAARPKTLSASAMPVVVACILAIREGKFQWIPAVICLLFAIVAQVVSNFFNDYSDFIKGSDRPDRLGPQRAVAGGWISPSGMLKASVLLMMLGCALGLTLVYFAGWKIIPVGAAVCIVAFAYSAGPYPLAYKGWGDVCVVLFYGVVPVVFTYYVQALEWSFSALICGLAMGFVSANMLVANNYRDRREDEIAGKRTTVVIFGESFGELLYIYNGMAAVGLCLLFIFSERYFAAFLPALYLIPHFATGRKMLAIRRGKALNRVLDESARNVLVFGALLCIGILL
jgi:1,4-dihydroxy-2-naphthoate octaprenyltransferase